MRRRSPEFATTYAALSRLFDDVASRIAITPTLFEISPARCRSEAQYERIYIRYTDNHCQDNRCPQCQTAAQDEAIEIAINSIANTAATPSSSGLGPARPGANGRHLKYGPKRQLIEAERHPGS